MYVRLRIINVYVKTVKELAENNLKTKKDLEVRRDLGMH